MGIDEVTWTAVAAVLTALGALWTVHAFRKRGVASGLNGLGLTLLPPALWATGTLPMLTEVGDSVARWAAGLVFSPLTWAGIVLAGLSVLLFGTSRALTSRGVGARPSRPATESAPPRGEVSGGQPAADPIDGLDDIEAILKRHGIQ
ncbi:hypothetical protein [Nocardioides limicola]|uniref:hypothetical protein n=1 Tax=Nocardioides limicola TaxID=2803368 RepID=UPI001EEF8C3A|nr:hypothetical protein [Nocardioides sp. DJM-14]